jgi:hypothetical protein
VFLHADRNCPALFFSLWAAAGFEFAGAAIPALSSVLIVTFTIFAALTHVVQQASSWPLGLSSWFEHFEMLRCKPR